VNRQQQRWDTEARFFDEWAARAGDTTKPVDPRTLARYGARSPRRRFNKEFRFRLLGDLRGRRVLDVGCGDGSNAVLLAKLGADVTGIDVSPKAIELAKRRAEINGVAERTTFVCQPLEQTIFGAASFDVIWGDAVLHHLIGELDAVVEALVKWTKPGGMLLFSEPVNFSPALRRLRFMIPVHTDATPDERPLEPAEIAVLRAHIPGMQVALFTMLGRLDRFVLRDYNYEGSAMPRRIVSSLLASADFVALRLPGLRKLAGTAVMWGRV
jgi:2-polyprenyl-3-methyl-5-hydroxy-6-metoxy-1,4-benzoquinol methylase